MASFLTIFLESPEHTRLLECQIKAFQLLSHNLDLTEEIQDLLLESKLPAKKFEPSFSTTSVDHKDFSSRAKHAHIPPSGGYQVIFSKENNPEKQEKIISNKISQRITQLERLPANLGTLDSKDISLKSSENIPDNNDYLKIRALIELKALRLLTKQKSLRQHLVFSLATLSDPISDSINIRCNHRRVKVPTSQDLRITEKLETQQRLERERKERLRQSSVINGIKNHAHQINAEKHSRTAKALALGQSILQAHNYIEKEEQRRAERTAKQRLQALKANDEEAYIKLLDQTKDTRITHLLKQTNSFLDSLTQRVKAQQQEGTSRRVRRNSSGEESDEESDRADYYEVAHRIKEEIKVQPSILVGGKLKDYQIKGLQWMVSLYNNNINGILADEMGLGKTIQSISLITYLIEMKHKPGPFLVIVPLSTLPNWVLEFEKWAPSVKKVVYKGTPNERRIHQSTIRSGDFQVLLTTYEYIIKDRPLLSKIKWIHMIIDEGHRMKNKNSKLSVTLTEYYTTSHRLILTGTPLQNSLPELWALLNFVLPKIFNSVKTFDEWFNTPFANTGSQEKLELNEEETLLIIRRLHKVLRPFLLRRLKKDVEKDLPDKVERVIKCKMSALQYKLYQHMLKYKAIFVGGDEGKPGKTKNGVKGLNNRIMQLRKICNHPFVFEETENLINPTHTNNDNLWRVAGKFELLDRILPKFKATGHRVLIFFQMTQIMDIMEDYLRYRGLMYLRLDGGTKADERSSMLKLFNAPDSPYFAFLLSTRAGGLGLNLQTADTVIIYDTDWNPHQDLQAQDRAHRIGQTKEVRILRLITEDSVEESILSRAHAKLEIDGKVIQAGKFDQKSTAEEQEAFLRSLLEAEEAKRNQSQEEEEIDDDELNEILARDENEAKVFKKIDDERNRTSGYGPLAGKPRLFSEEELPEEFKKEDLIEDLDSQEPENLGRGARERKRVYYDDGLTEEQWLEAMDDDNDTVEDAIERKRLRRERRRERMESKANTDDEEEKPEPPVEEPEATTGKRKRGRRKSKKIVEDDEDEEEGPPTKKRETEDVSSSGQDIESHGMKIINQLLNDVDSDDDHNRSDLFMELPDKDMYDDYYSVIKSPISISIIESKIKSHKYKNLEGLKKDLILMVENAMEYNEADSIVYNDALHFKGLVEKWYNDVINSNGESVAVAEGNGKVENEGSTLVVDEPVSQPVTPSGRGRGRGRRGGPGRGKKKFRGKSVI